MLSREGTCRTESRGRVNIGSTRDPAAGRSGVRSGRGGALDLPILPPRPRPAPSDSPCSPPRGTPPTAPGANGAAQLGPRMPIPGRAGRLRLPIGSAALECLPYSTLAGRRGPEMCWRELEAAWLQGPETRSWRRGAPNRVQM